MKYDFKVDIDIDSPFSFALRKIKPRSRVLEFGPASGYMTRYMKEQLHCSVVGVEIDREAALVSEVYCEKMIISDIDSMEWAKNIPAGKFDYILFIDVLEHLRNPVKALEATRQLLKKNGMLITSIPNIGHSAVIMELLQGLFEYRPLGLLDNTHIHFFTRKTIIKTLKQSGFAPVEWFSIVRPPEKTELQHKYNSFPVPVQKLLINRADAHVYQFITVAKRQEDVTVEEYQAGSNFETPPLYQEYLQVFSAVNNSFDELHSISELLQCDGEFHKYEIKLEGPLNGKIRFDPGSSPAYVELKSIEVYAGPLSAGNITEPLARYSGENFFVGLAPLHGIVEIEKEHLYKFICMNDDPHLLLEIPAIVDDSKIFTLLFIMKVDKLVNIAVAQTIENMTKRNLLANTAYEEKIVSYEENIRSYEKKIAEFAKQVKRCEEQINNQQAELGQVLKSYSWRITKPLRLVNSFLKQLFVRTK